MRSLLSLIVFVLGFLIVVPASPQKDQHDLQLPELHKIKHVSLSPSYSCRSKQESGKGYGNTALFLSDYSKSRNAPELLFNGACKSPDDFVVQTAGDDLDVITDYGDIPLASLVAQHVFSPQRRTDSLAKFAQAARTEIGHTYGVLINKQEARGFFYFRVVAYVPNQSVELEYVVEDYQVHRVEARSSGFSWDAKMSH